MSSILFLILLVPVAWVVCGLCATRLAIFLGKKYSQFPQTETKEDANIVIGLGPVALFVVIPLMLLDTVIYPNCIKRFEGGFGKTLRKLGGYKESQS